MTVEDSHGDDAAERETGDSRELGVDIGPLAEELESHTYPTTTAELLEEFGEYEIDISGGSPSLKEILGGRSHETEEYGSPEEVRQMIYNMVGEEAVGRKGYSDRGGTAGESKDESV